jgi:hypothetical protein
VYREEMSYNRFRADNEVDGMHSDKRSTRKAKSSFLGNSTRPSNASKPPGSEESGNYHSSKCVESNIRQEVSNLPLHYCKAIKDLGWEIPESQTEINGMGQDMGLAEGVHMGMSENVGGIGAVGVGLDKDVHELTSMEYVLTGAAKLRARVENIDASTPKLYLQTWKRMARKVNNDNVKTQPKSKAKRGMKESVINVEDGVEQTEKRMKTVEVAQMQSMEILVAAIEQPCKEP